MAHDRVVAGLRCVEVLAQLSDYIDQELDAAQRSKIDAHLAGCDWCAQFGGEVAATIREIQQTLSLAPEAPKHTHTRLDAALAEHLEEPEPGG